MEKEKFKKWLENYNYAVNTINSYSNAIDQISKYISEKRNEEIEVYNIDDLPILDKLKKSFIKGGNYEEFGNKGNGTFRNSILRLYEFKQSKEDLSYEPSEEIEIDNDGIVDISNPNFSYEKDLRNSMVSQITELFPTYKIFGKNNKGVEYMIEGKRIDILLENEKGDLLAIELKAGIANFKVFGQISMYLGLLMEKYPDKQIKGCIVAGEIDQTLKNATKTTNLVSLKTYKMKLELQDE